MGFAFSLIDAHRPPSGWSGSTARRRRSQPPPGGRFGPAVRDRLGSEPVTVPSAHWPAGTTLTAPDAVLAARHGARRAPGQRQREEFVRAGALPAFDTPSSRHSYGEDRVGATPRTSAAASCASPAARSTSPTSGFVRFEREGTDLVACHDLYSAPARRENARAARRRAPRPAAALRRAAAPQLRFERLMLQLLLVRPAAGSIDRARRAGRRRSATTRSCSAALEADLGSAARDARRSQDPKPWPDAATGDRRSTSPRPSPTAEQLKVDVRGDRGATCKFWTTIFDAAQDRGPVDRRRRAALPAAADHDGRPIKFDYPTVYA